jgi:two-component system sensor histidine kinase AlgZ
VRPVASAPRRLAAVVYRETLVAVAVGVPALAYVLATNRTASLGVVLLHAAPLAAITPILVSVLDLALPRAPRAAASAVLREVALRALGLSAATVGTLLAIAATTPLSLSVLVGGPLVAGLLPVYLAYALVGLGVSWAGVREHALRAVAAEARARQAALSARIRPHFLFNALNCIEELTDTDPPAARDAVGRLARLLRAVLESSAAPLGPLEREARLVDDYLGIEKIRFGDRFTYEIALDPAAAARPVPATVLLTLAENAVKHGVEAVRGPARVRLSARVGADGALRIGVTGPAGPAGGGREGSGYGLADVRERLRLAYEGRATFTLSQAGEGTADVELVLPA